MTPSRVMRELNEQLRRDGFDPARADPSLAFAAFLSTCSQGINQNAHALLVQWGTYDFTGSPKFSLDFVRQFEVAGADEYLQLHLKLLRTPDTLSDAINPGDLWSFPYKTCEDFRTALMALAPLRAAMSLTGFHTDCWSEWT